MKSKFFLAMCSVIMMLDSSNCTSIKSRSLITRPQTKKQKDFAKILEKSFPKNKRAPYTKKGELSERDRVKKVISKATDWMTARMIWSRLPDANLETIRGILTKLNQQGLIDVLSQPGKELMYAPWGNFSTKPQAPIQKRETYIALTIKALRESGSPMKLNQIASNVPFERSSLKNALKYGQSNNTIQATKLPNGHVAYFLPTTAVTEKTSHK